MKDMKETGVQSREKEHKHYERHEGDRSTEQREGAQTLWKTRRRQEYRAERRSTNTMKDMKETGVQSREKGHKHYEIHEGDRSTEQREGAQTL